MVIIDSCVWIEYFRSGQGKTFDLVDQLIDQNQVASFGIIELELFQGAFSKESKTLSNLFKEFHYLEMQRSDFVEAGKLLFDLRKQGITIPPSDGMIATLCIRSEAQLLSFDKHFHRIEKLQLIHS